MYFIAKEKVMLWRETQNLSFRAVAYRGGGGVSLGVQTWRNDHVSFYSHHQKCVQ